MYDFEKFEYEFSKIYRRLLRLELLIKQKIINTVLTVYPMNTMTTFKKFFNNDKIYRSYKSDITGKNQFLEIRDNKTFVDAVKFEQIINMLTLRHLLEFIFTEEAFRVPEIAKNFYARKDINFKELRKARIPLVKLRNYIAHFNFNEYSSDKAMYLHCLMLYELSLGCSLGQFAYLPNNLGYKPNMNTIISTIYDLCPDLFKKDVPHSNFPYNKDRMIVDMYEDIAVLNGWDYTELKSQWDVIRQKYRFNQEKTAAGATDLELHVPEQQTLIFDESSWG